MSEASSPFDALDAVEGPLTRVMVLKELDRWGAVSDEKRSPELTADVLGLQLGVTSDGDEQREQGRPETAGARRVAVTPRMRAPRVLAVFRSSGSILALRKA
ncbi:hypothetical protein Adeh_3542 [Anaeromyxobacter dehalogenans 2CP-C]|uniref:Uncharacterized protein n=1 Tax=Anaeromyxobacter dehalogenans (strain 2CP-C) TaxID=290397 RepID=Q2IFF3_ANADE|nr:hypothetical protein Adeh_3542 [Anaeromyxobacter dehalogenans 2CP-C]